MFQELFNDFWGRLGTAYEIMGISRETLARVYSALLSSVIH